MLAPFHDALWFAALNECGETMDLWGISQVFVVAATTISVGSLFRTLAKSCELPDDAAHLDEHYVPTRSAKPDNDVTPYPVDADTQPASRKRSDRRAA